MRVPPSFFFLPPVGFLLYFLSEKSPYQRVLYLMGFTLFAYVFLSNALLYYLSVLAPFFVEPGLRIFLDMHLCLCVMAYLYYYIRLSWEPDQPNKIWLWLPFHRVDQFFSELEG